MNWPPVTTALRWTLLAAMLGLAACAPTQRGDAPASWVDRTDAMRNLSAWSLNGRIGVQLDDRGFNGAVRWRQTGDAMRVNFHGPLGAGAFRISGNPDELVLETGDGDVYLLDDPQGALERELGWGVPMHAMRYWVIGIPHPEFHADQSFDANGRLVSIKQLEWVVAYERYGVFESWEMPRKMVLEKEGDARIKLVISRWSLDPPDSQD